MASVSVRHLKTSALPDGENSDLVQASDWNADHVVTFDVPLPRWLFGPDLPDDADGNDGDMYLVTDGPYAGNIYQRASGSWY